MENLTITKARERLREIAADLEYYRAVASYEMPESPCPPDVNFDDDDGVRFDKENKKGSSGISVGYFRPPES